MLKFPAQDHIEVYVGINGSICIRADSNDPDIGNRVIDLTIGQFRTIVSNADEIIKKADEVKKRTAHPLKKGEA